MGSKVTDYLLKADQYLPSVEQLEKFNKKMEDKNSTLVISVNLLGIALNARRVRRHLRKENYKRVIFYSISLGTNWGQLSQAVTYRLKEKASLKD
jgi:hypothetical protein